MNTDQLLKSMTLDEKIGQLQLVSVTEGNLAEVIERIKNDRVGACIVADCATAGNVEDGGINKKMIEQVKKAAKESRLKIPLLIGRDIIHGAKTIFPIPLAQAATWDRELIREAAARMSREANSKGINWTYAPMLDLVRDPRWGRVIESCGEDPYLGGEFAKASVDGIQNDAGIVACAKHFIGYSAVEGGRDYNKGEITDYTLRNSYLPAFRAAVDEGVGTVMNSFSAIGGTPSVANEYLFRELLKKEMCFDGFVVSDWGSIEWQMYNRTADSKEECAYNSIKAGIDMEMVTECYTENLKKLVEDGKIPEQLIDEAVKRILTVKQRFNLFDERQKIAEDSDNMEFAEKIAEHSMVLLKNNGGTLPLGDNGENILIIGPMARDKRSLSGSWCAGGNFDESITFEEAFGSLYKKSNIAVVDDFYESGYGRAKHFDTIILALGEYAYLTGERSCMSEVEISRYQLKLAKEMKRLGKKIIAVIFAGRPLAISELADYCDAVLYAWHSGMMAALAAAKIIKGDFVPCGKAPITFVRSTGQIPFYYNAPYLPIRKEKENAYYDKHSLSIYNDEHSVPMYPFGYGLSYTEFKYGTVKCSRNQISVKEINNGEKIKAEVTVENAGDYSAYEIIQMYVSAQKAKKQRPIKELRGFVKKYIEQGNKLTVIFEIGKKELGYYPEKELLVESGGYDIYIGGNCCTDNKAVIEVSE